MKKLILFQRLLSTGYTHASESLEVVTADHQMESKTNGFKGPIFYPPTSLGSSPIT